MTEQEISKKKGGTVRLSIPVKVAYNADAFQKSIYDLLDELGCRTCFSGVDCYFTTVRDFIVNPQNNEISQLRADEVSQFSALSQTKSMEPSTIRVGLSPKTAYNIKSVDLAIKNIFEEIGCLACCSGHDIFFQSQFDFQY